jgi:NitT/TauT family transport system substrate-binding protein
MLIGTLMAWWRESWSRWKHVAMPAFGLSVLFGLALGFGEPPVHRSGGGKQTIRLAYFPNLTHAPALAGMARDEFARAIPKGVSIDPKIFNAGPEEMEALLAGEVDMGYTGPSPAINTYLKTHGSALRVLAGACSGGSSLVARPEAGVNGVRDLSGKRVAVPQLGGTQDVSLRHFLEREGLRSQEAGGTVQIMPIKNPDILSLIQRKELDAAWVPEPWATRIVAEGGARRVLDERDLWPRGEYSTTVIVARTKFLETHPELVDAMLAAHLRTVSWLQAHPAEGQEAVNTELKRLTGKRLPENVMNEAWTRLSFTAEPEAPSIQTMARSAAEAGYLKQADLDLRGLFALDSLERARRHVAVAER